MADPHIRVIGRITDANGIRLAVGVDYDVVTIGGVRLGSAAAEEFARLYVAACWEAAHQRGQLAGNPAIKCTADCGGPVHDQRCHDITAQEAAT